MTIAPLKITQLPINKIGMTEFTYSRFLVPYLCGYQGMAMFMDCDMLLNGDITRLFDCYDQHSAIMLVKNRLKFEWSSLMLFNCAKCQMLTPELIENDEKLLMFNWLKPDLLGELAPEWNHLVGSDPHNDNAKIIHFTKGIPCFEQTKDCEHAALWRDYHTQANQTVAWENLAAKSVLYADD
ncbi:MAG: glycosyltransferase [Gammaproteobacteria bacterium]|nr:glycosyltransferase [Gammaproteobacteria bacterium]